MSDTLLQVLLVEDNPGDALLVREMISGADPDAFTLHHADSLLGGLDKLAQVDVDVILLDLNLPDSHGMETFSTMQVHAPHTPIVLLTGNDDDSLALGAVEAGAQDYLVKDKLEGAALVCALRYAVVRYQSQPKHGDRETDDTGCGVIAVLGAKGGVGATTVACHLAAAIRGQTEAPVLLVDLDFDCGSIGFLMQTKSPYTFLDAVNNLHRLDTEFWQNLVSKTAAGIDVMPSPGLTGSAEWPPGGRVRHTLRFARTQYAWIVADLGRLNALSVQLAPEMDEILLVTTAELVAVHHAGRTLEGLTSRGIDQRKISLIHNQITKGAGGPNVLKAVMDIPIRAPLPSCGSELAAAYTKGNLLDSSTHFGRQVTEMAAAVAGIEDRQDGHSGFSLRRLSLFGARNGGHTQPVDK